MALTFGDNIQNDIERDERSYHEQQGCCVHEEERLDIMAIVKEPNDEGHQAGFRPVDEQGGQVSEVIGNLTTFKERKKGKRSVKGTTYRAVRLQEGPLIARNLISSCGECGL